MALDRMLDGVWLTLAIAALAFAFAVLSLVLKPRLMGAVTAAVATLATSASSCRANCGSTTGACPGASTGSSMAMAFRPSSSSSRASCCAAADHPRAAVALEGMSLGLLISLVSLEIRVLIGGGITYEDPRFLEMAAHILTWAGAAYGLMHRQRLFSSFIVALGRAPAADGVGRWRRAAEPLALNPVVTGEPVAGGPFFNALLLAYLAPVPLIGLIAQAARRHRLGEAQARRRRPRAGPAVCLCDAPDQALLPGHADGA